MFGSYVRAEQKADSDLDIQVTFREAPRPLTFIAIENYLSDALGIKQEHFYGLRSRPLTTGGLRL